MRAIPPYDFHSSREGAPNPRRSRRDARRSDLTVELSAPPAGDAARGADPVHAAAREGARTRACAPAGSARRPEARETSGGVTRCVDRVPLG
eukprot:scaffold130273_cov44-Phaeocystis_antarctica.AAC.1